MIAKMSRVLLIIISILQLTATECMLPVKGVYSLETFEGIHRHLADSVSASQAGQIVNKITKLQQMPEAILYLSQATERLRLLPPAPKSGKDPDEAFRKQYIDEQKIFLETTGKEFPRLFGETFDIRENYGQLFLQKILDGIKVGNYNELFASLPKAFNAPIFNTFACIFSFIHGDNTVSTFPIPIKEVRGDLEIYRDTPVFISGESKLALAPMAIQAQASSLGGQGFLILAKQTAKYGC